MDIITVVLFMQLKTSILQWVLIFQGGSLPIFGKVIVLSA